MTWRSIPCFLCILLLLVSCNQKPVFKKHQSIYKLGDERAWAAKELDEEDWEPDMTIVPDGQVFWMRTKIDILKAPESLHPYGLQLEVYGEYEVFWDGELIGKNGNPGQEAVLPQEGELWVTFSIPTHLAKSGEHLLAIRSSLYHFPDHVGIYALAIGDYDALVTDRLFESSYMHLFAGAFLIAAIYFLFLFLSHKKEYTTLVFSICCLLFFSLILAEFSKAYIPIHYSAHVTRLKVIGSLMFGISFLIPFYFSMQFPIPRRKWLLTIYAGVLLYIFLSRYVYELTSNNMASSMWLVSFGIVVFGAYKKTRGAGLVLFTLITSLLIALVIPFDKSLFIGFGLILLSMLYMLSLRIKDQRLAYENSLVQSTRLRLELLKKNIQPHFLMNTLTSLIDWVEEEPKKGVLFIEALAKEFDLFNQIEDQTLIPIGQEIALCRTHLEIMAYRKEINYSWDEEGIDPVERIPPGVLHTLLENGITHSLPFEDNSIRFKLIYESNNDFKSYTFLTFAANVKQGTSTKEGTGLKYVKARLAESYQSKWDLISVPTNDGWKNVIKIYS